MLDAKAVFEGRLNTQHIEPCPGENGKPYHNETRDPAFGPKWDFSGPEFPYRGGASERRRFDRFPDCLSILTGPMPPGRKLRTITSGT